MDGGDGPSIELVEAAVVGRRTRVVAVEVPFVDQAGAVAGGAEDGGDGGVLRQEVGAPHIGGVAPWVDLDAADASGGALIVADAGVASVLAGHKRAARGRADAAACIALGETGAGGGEPVDVRGAYMLTAVAREIAVAHVVGKDEDDVGAVGRGLDLVTAGLGSLWSDDACGEQGRKKGMIHHWELFVGG